MTTGILVLATWTGLVWWGAIAILAFALLLGAVYHYYGYAGLLIVFVLIASGLAINFE